MARSKYFRSLVCVGREQYDFLIDTPLKPKLAYIDNGIHIESCLPSLRTIKKDPNLVVYMGALVPTKGFHQLAAAWPKVLERHPQAKLSVIGSVKMYGDNLKVGPLGVADEVYEKQFIIPYLCDEGTAVHKSVTFHGQLGMEKYKILQRASIGVANPTGQTETCCVSAVEMSACGIAVVTGAYYALLDTIIHMKTGLLGRGIEDLTENLCKCLSDPKLVQTLGENGKNRASQKFDFSEVAPQWQKLILCLQQNKQLPLQGKFKNVTYHFKLLRLLNYPLQSSLGKWVYWPSTFELQSFAQKLLRRRPITKK